MADELIDELDSNGSVIGTIMKSVAHKTGAWHRATRLYLVNQRNEILLQLRAGCKAQSPYCYDPSAAGHVAAGEDTKTAILRECQEEIGVTLSPKDIKFICTVREDNVFGDWHVREFIDIYMARTTLLVTDFVADKTEVERVEYFPLDKFTDMVKLRDKRLCNQWDAHESIIAEIRGLQT
ncbi:MAG: NUDIX domain-containing protein [Firmicutes bacterium]|nr:NUDIX domain-containing protein [Bacillota bacterium]